jgi:acyl carrier protein
MTAEASGGLTSEGTAAALRLAPLPGSPDPRSVASSWAELLPSGVTVVQPATAGEGDATPLVLLGGGADIALAVELASELARSGRRAPLALLTCGSPATAGAAEADLAVFDLGVAGDAIELAGPLSRELRRLAELGREVRSFVDSELLDGQAGEVTDTTPLLELGIVDSISIVAVVAFVEGDLGIPVPEGDIHPRHLADVLSICRLILNLEAARRHGRER